jgi:hypothetical protein
MHRRPSARFLLSRLGFLLFFFFSFFGYSTVARAEPSSITGSYSAYEMTAINDALRSKNKEVSKLNVAIAIDPSPEGKIIERIEFVRLDPIDQHDPIPTALDKVHTTSKPYVLRRTLLASVTEGQPYRRVLVDESARNLRKLRQLSLVILVPITADGAKEDHVTLLVITKDVWSLYVDFDLAVTSGGLESLTLEPKETNIAGIHHAALGRFVLEPQTVTLGASYEVPRVDGRWLSILADANAVMNREEEGGLEGGYGQLRAQRPLFSSRTEWSWSSGFTLSNRIRRRYSNAEVKTFEAAPPIPGGALEKTSVPWMYRERLFSQDASVTRSFGWETKNDFTLGAALTHSRYEPPASPNIDPAALAAFTKAAVPIGENRVGPFLQWHSYRSDFLRTIDLAGLGLQEDHRLGHDIYLRAYPVLRAFGSTRDLIGGYGGAAYSLPLGDGVVRAAVESTVEARTSKDADVTDASIKGSITIATPRFGPKAIAGRFIFGVSALNRIENYLNAQSFLGGESLLRGYPSRYFAGKDFLTSNIEYRTRSIDLSAILLSAAAFYDVGDAFSGFDHLDPKQSVGGGLRIVFPQIDRAVLRVDVGVPITSEARGPDLPPVSVFIAFHQPLALPSLSGGGTNLNTSTGSNPNTR